MSNNVQKDLRGLIDRSKPYLPGAVQDWVQYLKDIKDGKFGELDEVVANDALIRKTYDLAQDAKGKILELKYRGFLTEEDLKYKDNRGRNDNLVYEIFWANFLFEHREQREKVGFSIRAIARMRRLPKNPDRP